MAILSLGTLLSWDAARKFLDHVRYHGISQLLNMWDRTKDRQGDELLWGDEVSLWPHALDRCVKYNALVIF
jgi:glutamate--cysteine ligase catalytic subunit